MSSADMFASSEEVDNPVAMETDDNKDDDSEDKVRENQEAEAVDEEDDVEAGVESGDNDDGEEEAGVLQDRSSNMDNSAAAVTPSKEEPTKLFRFPQGRIKSIMKLDPDVGMVNGEAIFLVNKACEEFIQCLAVEAYHYTASSKKKTIMKDHVMTAIESIDELAFLDGAMDD